MMAGRLRHWIYIEEPTSSQSSSTGQRTDEWSVFAYVPARITPSEALASQERHIGQQLRTSATHSIEIRYISGLLYTHRLRLAPPGETARIFEIRGITDPDERRKRLLIEAEEIA